MPCEAGIIVSGKMCLANAYKDMIVNPFIEWSNAMGMHEFSTSISYEPIDSGRGCSTESSSGINVILYVSKTNNSSRPL